VDTAEGPSYLSANPRPIAARMSRTARSIPTNTASAITACPMFSSTISAMAATSTTLWRFRPCPAATSKPKSAARLAEAGIKPSLFIAPDAKQIEASRRAGARQIELHTGEYCDARGTKQDELLGVLIESAAQAADLGFEVAAGHGLNRHNVVAVAAIAEIVELNIGHAVIADAVFVGIDRAVRDMRAAMGRGIALR
jgi:hypothetical protein